MKLFYAKFLSFFAAAAFLIAGCGYNQKAVLPNNIKTIYVDTVKNAIPVDELYAYQPGVEIDISNAIVKRLNQDGNLKVVPREQADAVLESYLIGYTQAGLRFTRLERVEEYRLYITLAIRLIDAKTGAVIWEESNLTGDSDYEVESENNQNPYLGGPPYEYLRENATTRAVVRLARNVVDRIVEDW